MRKEKRKEEERREDTWNEERQERQEERQEKERQEERQEEARLAVRGVRSGGFRLKITFPLKNSHFICVSRAPSLLLEKGSARGHSRAIGSRRRPHPSHTDV